MYPNKIDISSRLIEVTEELLITELPPYQESSCNEQDATSCIKDIITHYQNEIWPLNDNSSESQIEFEVNVNRPIPPPGSNSVSINFSQTGPLVIRVPGFKVFKTKQILKIDEPLDILGEGKNKTLLYSGEKHVIRQKQYGEAASALACVHMIQMDMDKELDQTYPPYSRKPYGFQQIKKSLLDSEIHCNRLAIRSMNLLRIALEKAGSLIVKGQFKNYESYFIIDALDDITNNAIIRDPYHGWRAYIDFNACLEAIKGENSHFTVICINTGYFNFNRYM